MSLPVFWAGGVTCSPNSAQVPVGRALLAGAQASSRVRKQTSPFWLEKAAPLQGRGFRWRGRGFRWRRRGFQWRRRTSGWLHPHSLGVGCCSCMPATWTTSFSWFILRFWVLGSSECSGLANAARWRQSYSSQSQELFVAGGYPWELCCIILGLDWTSRWGRRCLMCVPRPCSHASVWWKGAGSSTQCCPLHGATEQALHRVHNLCFRDGCCLQAEVDCSQYRKVNCSFGKVCWRILCSCINECSLNALMSVHSMLLVPSLWKFLCPSCCCELPRLVKCPVAWAHACAEGTLSPATASRSPVGMALSGETRGQRSGAGQGHGVQPGACRGTPSSRHAGHVREIHSSCWREFLVSGQEVMEQGWAGGPGSSGGEEAIRAGGLGGSVGSVLPFVLSTASRLMVFLFCFSNSHFRV